MVILSTMPYPTQTLTSHPTGGFDAKIPEESDSSSFSLLSVLKIPGVMLAVFGVFAAASSAGFVNATLEPHIRQVMRQNRKSN